MSFNQFDGFDQFQRPDSTQGVGAGIASLYIGIVTRVDAATNSAFVRIPALNENADLGPYKCLQPFTNQVTTDVKQTLTTTSGSDPDGGTFLTSASLSSTTTALSGTYGSLNLPSQNNRVLVALIDNSIDDAVIVGKI